MFSLKNKNIIQKSYKNHSNIEFYSKTDIETIIS